MRLANPPDSCRVFTPPDLAAAMVKAVGDADDVIWLEPSHGTGVFVQAISDLGVSRRRIVAVELDRRNSPADSLAKTVRGKDFLRWSQVTSQRFDRIIGNPPFVSIKRLPVSLRQAAAAIVDLNGNPIGEGANTWYAFVLASLRLLKEGGSLAFVLPSAAEFTKYSAPIRSAVHKKFERLELYRCKRPLFEGVQEGTLVAIARSYSRGPCKVRRRRFNSRHELIRALENSEQSKGRACKVKTPPTATMVPLKSIARIRLGGVTGDASFFLMNEERRKLLALPAVACTPVLSKARHLRFPTFEKSHWTQLRQDGERIWLFNPTTSLIRRFSKVKGYLYRPAEKGGCNREAYKVKDRKPWYRTPLLSRTDAFVSGMSQAGPWLCINEMPELRATNTLYVVNFSSSYREQRYMWGLSLLTSIAQRQIRGIARHYADGLIKYEPGELAEVELPSLRPDVDHRSLYERAVAAVLANDLIGAKAIADSVRL
jgi:adenine-specific DNA-methyltransferase